MKVLCFNVSGAKNCCLCIKARTGAYIIAILGIIFGIFSLIYIFEKEKGLQRVDENISNIKRDILIYCILIYCSIATTILSTINSCFLLLGLVKNSTILLTTWLIIAGIGILVFALLFVLELVVSFFLLFFKPFSFMTSIVCIYLIYICLPLLVFLSLAWHFWLVVYRVRNDTKDALAMEYQLEHSTTDPKVLALIKPTPV